ncbi:TPA: hypothetical protein PX800_003781 [Vibrio cholerae]|nr:hypothetical protein [Vibrio cholerae]
MAKTSSYTNLYSFVPTERRKAVGMKLVKRNGQRCWNSAELSRLKALYDEGLTSEDIASLLGRSSNAVRLKLSRLSYTSKYHCYTIQEDAYIRKYYGFKSLSEIAEHLGVSVSSLVDRATKALGLKNRYCGENSPSCKLSDEDVEFIRQLHEEGLACSSIAEKFEVSPSYVNVLVNFKSRTCLTVSR